MKMREHKRRRQKLQYRRVERDDHWMRLSYEFQRGIGVRMVDAYPMLLPHGHGFDTKDAEDIQFRPVVKPYNGPKSDELTYYGQDIVGIDLGRLG